MRLAVALFFAALTFGQVVPAVNTPVSSWPLGAVPVWIKVVVANSGSNLTVTCTPAIATCGTSPVAKAGAVTQSVALMTPAVSFVLDGCVAKTGTAFTGTTALTSTVGITGTLTGCVSVAYDMKAAVSVTNFGLPTLVTNATSFNGTDSVLLALTSTIDNVSSISAGSITVWLRLVLLP